MTREAQLHQLLLELFPGPEDLNIYVGNHFPELLASVAWRDTPSSVAFRLTRVLDSRGYLDLAFFQGLADTQPRKGGRVQEVAESWGVRGLVVPAAAPPPAAPPPAAPPAQARGVVAPQRAELAQAAHERLSPSSTRPTAATPTLTILHGGGDRFSVLGEGPAPLVGPVDLPDPESFVATPDFKLSRALAWALEEYAAEPDRAMAAQYDAVLGALRRWGNEVGERLLVKEAYARYRDEARAGRRPRIVVHSNDPSVLGWPWEAVQGQLNLPLGIEADLVRSTPESFAVPRDPPADREVLEVLLITARPGGTEDVGYLQVAEPIAAEIAGSGAPIRLTLLRPPTLDALHGALRQGVRYQVVHFDGHGLAPGADQGSLLFEDEYRLTSQVSAQALAAVLMKHEIPLVVLNACSSAAMTQKDADPFSTVATALVRAGVRAVVAMSYKLNITGARLFGGAFYRELAESGDVESAVHAARSAMHRNASRAESGGPAKLDDWMLPVLYARERVGMPLKAGAPPLTRPALPPRPSGLGAIPVVGRDDDFLQLERTLIHSRSLLLGGPPRIGRTALAWAFACWRAQTEGAGAGVVWVDAGAPTLLGAIAGALGVDAEPASILRELRARPRFLVVDRLLKSHLDDDATLEGLRALLTGLQEGASRLLLVSAYADDLQDRISDPWVPIHALGPLPSGQRWRMLVLAARLRSSGVNVFTPEMRQLAEATGGHPWLLLELAGQLRAGPAVLLPRVEVARTAVERGDFDAARKALRG